MTTAPTFSRRLAKGRRRGTGRHPGRRGARSSRNADDGFAARGQFVPRHRHGDVGTGCNARKVFRSARLPPRRQAVTCDRRRAAAWSAPTRTASGLMAVQGAKAWSPGEPDPDVEGRHDAELVEKVWGEDLRLEGVVVEDLGRRRRPGSAPQGLRARTVAPCRVLVDDLVAGRRRSRIADAVRRGPNGSTCRSSADLRRRLAGGGAAAGWSGDVAGGARTMEWKHASARPTSAGCTVPRPTDPPRPEAQSSAPCGPMPIRARPPGRVSRSSIHFVTPTDPEPPPPSAKRRSVRETLVPRRETSSSRARDVTFAAARDCVRRRAATILDVGPSRTPAVRGNATTSTPGNVTGWPSRRPGAAPSRGRLVTVDEGSPPCCQ